MCLNYMYIKGIRVRNDTLGRSLRRAQLPSKRQNSSLLGLKDIKEVFVTQERARMDTDGEDSLGLQN